MATEKDDKSLSIRDARVHATLGFAALRDANLVHEFADIIRQEYLAIGFRLALHPQVDLAIEPRWARISSGFGEDANMTSQLAASYIKGLQDKPLGPQSTSAMTKHFPGGGPQKDGEDSHFTYGREQIYDGDNMYCCGLEHLSRAGRIKRLLEGGCDMICGKSCPELIVQLVQEGLVPESRIDISVKLVLREKLILGLFDNPFVDVDPAAEVNENDILPLRDIKGKAVYLEGFEHAIVEARGYIVVGKLEDAEIAFLRLKAPYEPRPGGFEEHFHAGSLEFSSEEKPRQAAIFKAIPIVITDLYLDRPAAIPEITEAASVLLVSYGSTSEAFLNVVTGNSEPTGLLFFELPSSRDAVRISRSDVPYDTKDPFFSSETDCAIQGHDIEII
ncbi:hypothetical protein TSTA_091600 [Talaromyces stipitatus ATCC 10500]|uniref:beta-glucosidase n=1 Tax=Talaromyces stipitatus (strain ATCC 10500 / CBS 375.48 / QM 6759 / NRRL 1006) TaxID=441959 RepID=B8M2K8_TALSN|nr:uncharacterized protein TSTA_091600 [Talaromyces stipitatus ATCC 10500]EED21919.1 hypothetical protein TSTA_091600 [Talaromyces stipitatus ATCC 10500]